MDTQARFRSLSTSDMVIGGALFVGLIALLLPWFGVSTVFESASINGFHSWGLAYFVAWLVGAAFWAVSLFRPEAISGGTVQPWQVFMAIGIFMAIFALIYWADAPSASFEGGAVSYGVRFGWFMALVAAIVVAVGGYMHRAGESAGTVFGTFGSSPSGARAADGSD